MPNVNTSKRLYTIYGLGDSDANSNPRIPCTGTVGALISWHQIPTLIVVTPGDLQVAPRDPPGDVWADGLVASARLA